MIIIYIYNVPEGYCYGYRFGTGQALENNEKKGTLSNINALIN